MDFNNPKTFNEKLQWLKLHDRKPIYTVMVDKVAVKDYVRAKIGDKYIIPTLGVYSSFSDIDFTKLPNRFVLKCSHDSGSIVICKDKNSFDYEEARRILENGLKRNWYLLGREWPYKNVPPRIIAEQYLEDAKTGELRDYKFFCYDGVVKTMFIATDRQNREEPYFDFFDAGFNHLDIQQGHPNAPIIPEKPEYFDEMKILASKLSKGISHVRVDFFEVDGRIYFGEMTFFHFCGVVPFKPARIDTEWGNWIKLPCNF